jgi:hypothetical protein
MDLQAMFGSSNNSDDAMDEITYNNPSGTQSVKIRNEYLRNRNLVDDLNL